MSSLIPPPNNPVGNTHEWRDWFFKVYIFLNTASANAFNGLSFLGSNITSIVTRNHNDLTTIQGGDSLNRYHLTSAEYTSVGSLGTMSSQNSGAVAITGGTATVTLGLTNTTGTTVGAAGTATVPPLPVGYIAITIGGTAYKMPYYNV